jgi:hypothetical protein
MIDSLKVLAWFVVSLFRSYGAGGEGVASSSPSELMEMPP